MSVAEVRRGERGPLAALGLVMAALLLAYDLGGANPYTAVGIASSAAAGLIAAGAVVFGVRRFRPRRRWPWYLLAVTPLADAGARVLVGSLRLAVPVDANGVRAVPVYALALALFVTFVTALLGLAWEHGEPHALPTAIDSAIVVLGVGLLAWVAIARPWTDAGELTPAATAFRISFVVRDVLVLVALLRLLSSVRWNGAVAFLTAGTVALLSYDAQFESALIRGNTFWGESLELLWFAFYAGLGAAALVPSMATVGARPRHADGNDLLPLVMVSLSALVPFGLLVALPAELANGLLDHQLDALGITAAVMLALVLARLTVAAVQLRRSLTQAQVVGDASTALVGAAEVPAIDRAVSAAAHALFAGRSHPSARLVAVPHPDAPLAGPGTLRIPLNLPGAPASDDLEPAGALEVRASPGALAANRGSLRVVAAQASLALARVHLTDEVMRTRRDEYFRALVQNSADVILIVEASGRIRYASPSAAKLFESSTVDGELLGDLLDPADRESVTELVARIHGRPPSGERNTLHADWGVAGPAGRRVEVSCDDLRQEPTVRGVVVTMRDVTERRRLESRLTALALHDPLTGLGNRSLFMSAVERAIEAGDGAAMLFVDLDDFKVINDSFGHVLGDALLQEVAQRIRAAVAPHGLAARVGGDEFATLVAGRLGPAEIDAMATRIVEAVSRPVAVHGEVLVVGASVGVATTADADGSQDLLRHADLALYEAKGGGKHQFRHYHPDLVDIAAERGQLRLALVEAMGSGGLELWFQPIVALDAGNTVGFEAQLGWRHPERGPVAPAELDRLAADAGLADEIGEWTLRAALREAARWAVAVPRTPPYVSVSVSARYLDSPGAAERIRGDLAECGVPPQRLVLQVAESLLHGADDTVVETLVLLGRLGVRIAVDEFGYEYARTGNLRRIPLNAVRLAGYLTGTTSGSGPERDLVAGLVRLARALRVDVVATGVETGDGFGVARLLGCPYGQGHAVSRPLTPDAALHWATHAQVHPPAGAPG